MLTVCPQRCGFLVLVERREVIRNRAVVVSGVLKRFAKQPEVRRRRERAIIRLQFGHNRIVIFGVDDHADVLMIFRRGAHHARPADVDVFDDFLEAGAARHRGFKRVKIDDDEIDGQDAVLFHFGDVRRIVAQSENATVDFRMQGFHPAVHHLGKTGELGNILHRDFIVAQKRRGAAG
jgi:hypothetical protein